MNSLKLILFVLLIIAIAVLPGHTQTVPTIKNVSVINEQGHVRLSWEYDGTENLIIKRDTKGFANSITTSPIDTITNPLTTSYIDSFAQAHLNPRAYIILVDRITPQIGTAIVSTYHLTYDYDSCANEIQLNWTDFQLEGLSSSEWTPTKFTIYVNEEGSLKEFTAAASENSFTVEDIEENTQYTFKIGVEWIETDSMGFSNPVSPFTEMPLSPKYIDAIYARTEGNNTNLKFEIAPNSKLSNYKLLQSNSPTENYDTLETINTNDYEIVTTHENSNPESEINYYKLVSINNCGNITTKSDIINNIRLEIENDDYNNLLSWNHHKEYSLVDASYDIYRIAGNSDPEFVRSYSNHYNYSDNIESFQGAGLYGQFCYFIRATEAGGLEYSQSNTACIFLEPEVFVPEAFTPNTNDNNSIFKPVFSFLPVDYQLIIYNRWANIVFETSDADRGWNGKESNGKPAPTGTYIYYIKIKTPGNQIVEKRGNITVFYP